MKRRSQKRKGFTLLELLIVVVVLAVLAGLALPQYLRVVARSREAEGWQMMASIRSAEMRYYAEWEGVNAAMDLLDITAPTGVNFPNAMFTYGTAGVGLDKFQITATPIGGKCAGCKNLKLDSDGTRTEF